MRDVLIREPAHEAVKVCRWPKSSEHKTDQVKNGLAHGRVKWFHGTGSDETIFFFQEATLVACEGSPKQTPVMIPPMINKGESRTLSKQV